MFAGVPGSTYGFFSVARDNAGNLEASPASAEATTTVTGQPSAPPLQIRLLTNGIVQVSWPTSAVNYVLQTIPALNSSSSWSTVTDPPSVVGDRFMLTFSAQDGARYYRLSALPQLPILSVVLTNGMVQVSWPTSAVNYVLQAAPALSAAPDWRTVTNRPSIVGDQFILTLSAQDGARYYRLHALPQLTIQWTNNQVMLSWPKSATDFRLLTATNPLPVTQWRAMSYTPLTNADRSVLFIAPGNPSRFYRLVSP
jgi:hypothetical protein